MKNKIIFLDVDGVLNFNGCTDRIKIDGKESRFLGLSKDHVARLNRIIKEVDCDIILSSTWRLSDFAQKYLNEFGIHEWSSRNIGRTVSLGDRGKEILVWMEMNGFTGKYAVIDDVMCDGIPAKNMFNTSFMDGLTDEIANNIIKFFNEN